MREINSESIQMGKESISSSIANASATIGASTGFMAFVNENAGFFSLGIGFVSLLITIVFGYLGWRSRVRTENINKMKYELDLERYKAEQHEKRIKQELPK